MTIDLCEAGHRRKAGQQSMVNSHCREAETVTKSHETAAPPLEAAVRHETAALLPEPRLCRLKQICTK